MSGTLPENQKVCDCTNTHMCTCVAPCGHLYCTFLLYPSNADTDLLLLKEYNLFSHPPGINHIDLSPEDRQLAFQGCHKEENRAWLKSGKILDILISSDCPHNSQADTHSRSQASLFSSEKVLFRTLFSFC